MDHEPTIRPDDALLACAQRIWEKVRFIGAIAEVFQLFDGMASRGRLEPDCLSVIGKLIVDRASGILEAVT